jgi:two-component system sensor histidine kinase TtrS
MKRAQKSSRILITLLIIGVFASITTNLFAGDEYKIGVLAKRGAAKCMQQWKATADYLNQKIAGKTFVIVPLDFGKIEPQTASKGIDFVLANSSFFVELEHKHGVKAVATMINTRQGQSLKEFGGLVVTKAGNSAINSFADLKGKKFMAVDEASFGGWQMAYRELVESGIDPKKDFAKLVFGKTHDNVLLAVRNGVMDAGTVRTDTYERMAAEGKVDMGDFKIINEQKHAGFPFVSSTRLYPEWPLAKLAHVPDAVANEVASALIAMDAGSQAAKDAKITGWSKPLDYQPVDDCLKVLHIGPYGK